MVIFKNNYNFGVVKEEDTMLSNLIPISDEHSIAKVRAMFFVPQPLVKPADIFKKINSAGRFESFARKGMINSKHIEFSNQDTNIRDHESGFVFEEFNKTGSLKSFIRVENIKENQSLITFESREYSDWTTFKSVLKYNIQMLSINHDFYINAVSLDYQDEFLWKGSNEIEVQKIFNADSELLNKKFLQSKNGSLILISQDTTGDLQNEEKTELSFNNNVKRIVINHQYAVRTSAILLKDFIDSTNFDSCFDKAHDENKNILESVLSEKTQILIGLKK